MMQCLVCRSRIDAMAPYPQVCNDCRSKGERSLVAQLHHDVDRLAKTWGALVTPELEPRFTKMLEAASELDLPMTVHRRADVIAKFGQRVAKTIEQQDAFAALVKAWWMHRIRKGDLRALELQLAWAKIQTEGRNAPQSES
tara:strand:+ start:105 stop:527 length:423 start_codon:yes stop_codon:yes gene_type:complete